MTGPISLCVPEELRFRAACNAAADPSYRPLKLRVIRRLSDFDHFGSLFDKLWAAARASEEAFFEALGHDPLWQTAVAETAVNERSWLSLANKDFWQKGSNKISDKVWDWSLAAIEKLWDRKHHPATAMISTIALTLAIPLAVSQIFPNLYRELTKPIRVAVIPDLQELDKGYNDFKARLEKDPLSIQVRPAVDAIPIKFVGDPVEVTTKDQQLQEALRQLKSGTLTLRQIASSMSSIQRTSVALNGKDLSDKLSKIADNVSQTTVALNNANLELESVKKTLGRQNERGIQVSADEAAQIDKSLQILARSSARQIDRLEEQPNCKTRNMKTCLAKSRYRQSKDIGFRRRP